MKWGYLTCLFWPSRGGSFHLENCEVLNPREVRLRGAMMSAAKWEPASGGRREVRRNLRGLRRGGGREEISLSLALGPGRRLERGSPGRREEPSRRDSWLEEGPLGGRNEE